MRGGFVRFGLFFLMMQLENYDEGQERGQEVMVSRHTALKLFYFCISVHCALDAFHVVSRSASG